MAELYSLRKKTADPGSGALPQVAPAAPGWGQTHPLWRSILSPSNDQRVLILDRVPDGVFKSLLGEGVRLQGPQPPTGGERGPYDLVLEGVRARWFGTQSGGSRSSMVVPGGKWVTVVEGTPFVGLQGRAVRRRARREGFERVETMYAHPSLSSPEILVPLERVEPIGYFLELAMGERTFKKRFLAFGFLLLAKLGLHRELLPNLFLTARR